MDQWDVQQVSDWITSIGFGKYASRFRENEITGDILIHGDHDMLKELDITSVGQRIALLKSVYNMKLAQGIPLDDDDYIPETAVVQTSAVKQAGWSVNKRRSRLPAEDYTRLENMIKEKDLNIIKLTNDINRLTAELTKLKDDLTPVWALIKEYKNFQAKARPKNQAGQLGVRTKSSGSPSGSSSQSSSSPAHTPTSSSASKSQTPKVSALSTISKTSPLKSPAISRANPSQSKPSPVDLGEMSPITPLGSASLGDVGAIRVYGDKLLNRENEAYKSFKVSLSDPCSKILPAVLKKYKLNDDWQQYALFVQFKGLERCLSFDERPLVLHNQLKDGDDAPIFVLKHIKQVKSPASRTSDTSKGSEGNTKGQDRVSNAPLISSASIPSSSASMLPDGTPSTSDFLSKAPTLTRNNGKLQHTGNTSAVAIYEYKGERDDELDVAIGDRFTILNRDTGWCMVEKDGKRGWIPAGCLLESEDREDEEVDTSVPQKGIVLYDYNKISPNEVSIKRGDMLIIHKKYQHWLLVDCNDQRGWVPSCYVSINKFDLEGVEEDFTVTLVHQDDVSMEEKPHGESAGESESAII
ncbi:Adaptor for signal transduction [Quaeritorhiza haematococci]|nr:Adaptor for signal transduction [Quaeritorhiza haematococci]